MADTSAVTQELCSIGSAINRFPSIIEDSCPHQRVKPAQIPIIDLENATAVGEAPQPLSAGGDSTCRTMLPSSAHCIVGPRPVPDFRHVLPVTIDIAFVLDQFIAQLLLQIDPPTAGLRQSIDGINPQVKTIQLVQPRHVERRGDSPLFLVSAHMQVLV